MRKPKGILPLVLTAALIAGAAAASFLITSGSRAQPQGGPAPCACSRATPVAGADDTNAVPGQLAPRYGIVHCQCGAATCVSQVAYGSLGVPQLFCVK